MSWELSSFPVPGNLGLFVRHNDDTWIIRDDFWIITCADSRSFVRRKDGKDWERVPLKDWERVPLKDWESVPLPDFCVSPRTQK